MRQSEVDDARLIEFVDSDIRWLQIAMDDSLSMRRIDRGGNLCEHLDDFALSVLSAAARSDPFIQIDALYVLHHKEIRIVSRSTAINDADDSRMAQCGHRLHFALKPCSTVSRHPRHDLYRHRAARGFMDCFKDCSLCTGADLSQK